MDPVGMARKDVTREEWLNNAIVAFRPLYESVSCAPVDVRVSVGWPIAGGRPGKKTTIGQCWGKDATADKKPAIFISPILADGYDAVVTLAHELIHAYVGTKCGHKGEFRKVALAIGFEGPMRTTPVGAELKTKLEKITRQLGPYPHAKVNPDKRKKQGTRLLKAECPECGYTVRVTKSWLANAGAPICPLDKISFTAELPDEEEEDGE